MKGSIMPREIKFRAWDGFEMVYAESYEELSGLFARADYEGGWIFMMFTGLKDKNGKEIYEGDVLSVGFVEATSDFFQLMKKEGDQSVKIILDVETEWLCTCFRFDSGDAYYVTKDPNGPNLHFLRYVLGKKTTEVIGNIHQNPELLK